MQRHSRQSLHSILVQMFPKWQPQYRQMTSHEGHSRPSFASNAHVHWRWKWAHFQGGMDLSGVIADCVLCNCDSQSSRTLSFLAKMWRGSIPWQTKGLNCALVFTHPTPFFFLSFSCPLLSAMWWFECLGKQMQRILVGIYYSKGNTWLCQALSWGLQPPTSLASEKPPRSHGS